MIRWNDDDFGASLQCQPILNLQVVMKTTRQVNITWNNYFQVIYTI